MSTAGNAKKELRERILRERSGLPREAIDAAARVVCETIRTMDMYREADDICLYVPIRNELDVMPLAAMSEEDGKRVWLPRVIERKMDFYRHSQEDDMRPGAYGIPEPTSDEKLVPAGVGRARGRTLIVMPGAVFSVSRDRIGYGGGYYDRYLAEHPLCRTLAACYDFQIVDEIPAEEHDMKPEAIVSEKRVLI